MSEPVGNSPRMESLPNNSHKAKEREKKEEPEVAARETLEAIVVGKVVQRKQPKWKTWARSIVAEDAQSIGDYIVTDVVIPAIKRTIMEMVSEGTSRALFGSSAQRIRNAGGRGEGRGGLRNYNGISRGEEQPRRMLSRDARARHDFDEVILDNREEAITVVEELIVRIRQYGAASVADLYDLLGVTGSYADRNWGWTDLRDADVRQSRGGWLLDLPRPVELR